MSESRIFIPNTVSNIFEKIATILDCIKETNLEFIPSEVSFDSERINFNVYSKADKKSATVSILKSKDSPNNNYYGLNVMSENESISNNILKEKIDNLIGFIESCRELTNEQIKLKYNNKIKGISRQMRWVLIIAVIVFKFYYFFNFQMDNFKEEYIFNNVYTREGYSIAFDSFVQNWFISFGIQIVMLYLILKYIMPIFKPKGNALW